MRAIPKNVFTLRRFWQPEGPTLGYVQSAAAGPPMLFFHGVLRSSEDFCPLFPGLAASHSLLAVDHRGHGRSESAGGAYRVLDYAADAVAWTRAMVDAPAVLYGHSLGAMVAACVAAAVPEKVRALVLEDPPFETLGPGISATPFAPLFVGLRGCLPAHRQTRTPSDPPTDEHVRRLAADIGGVVVPTASGAVPLRRLRDATQLRLSARCLLDLDPEVFLPLLQGRWLEGWDIETTLRQLQCPTLLLVGNTELGGMLSPELADRTAAEIEDCTRVDFPDAGHLLHWTRTQGVLRYVEGFLASLAPVH